MVVTSNTKNKEKTKTLNKVIEQEAFSEGFFFGRVYTLKKLL